MGVIALMCSVVDSPVADIPITETPAITDGIETTVVLCQEKVQIKYNQFSLFM